MIKNLKEIKKEEVNLFGGKATNLAFLMQNGFNVPEGFCISTKINKLSKEIKKEIILKFKELKSKVAVRSSATVEDSEKLSFAGQFDTFLNIKIQNELFNSIKKCRKSLNSERAIVYTKNKRIKNVKMAVIIQKMIDADFAGVIFTLDPMDKKYILIEAAKGLGEKIVSGRITPNNYFINKNNFKIIRKSVKEKINENSIIKIAKIGRKIEMLYNKPQDIEFAFKRNKIFILQSRPITA